MMVFLNFFLEVSTFSVSILVGQMFEQWLMNFSIEIVKSI
jgi:hypothetical protein